MPRVPRSVYPDGHFHATARGAGRMAIYRDDEDRLAFLGLVATVTDGFSWTCNAFCLMTNHYHLVLESTRVDLSAGLHRLNGVYAQAFNGRYGRWGHVFGDRFWCRSLDEHELEQTCHYVLDNPVRAGLCAHADDWPWSACRFDLS